MEGIKALCDFPVSPDFPWFASMSKEEAKEVIRKHVQIKKKKVKGKLYVKYRNTETLRHAEAYCKPNNNSCGEYFQGDKKSDCAHFMGHCLTAGGIKIVREGGPECPHNSVVRVAEIVRALRALALIYENVRLITYEEAIIGDPAFLRTLVRDSHAVIIKEAKSDTKKTTYYAHSRNRCGTVGELNWYQCYGVAFRLEDCK